MLNKKKFEGYTNMAAYVFNFANSNPECLGDADANSNFEKGLSIAENFNNEKSTLYEDWNTKLVYFNYRWINNPPFLYVEEKFYNEEYKEAGRLLGKYLEEYYKELETQQNVTQDWSSETDLPITNHKDD